MFEFELKMKNYVHRHAEYNAQYINVIFVCTVIMFVFLISANMTFSR